MPTVKKTKKHTQLKLPPPRPVKLTIPVPKCQHVQHQNNSDIKLTPDEVDEYCNRIKADKITRGAAIAEASLLVNKTNNQQHTTKAAAGYTPRALPDLITYYHAAAGYPMKTTWIQAIKRGHYIGWPGLTTEHMQKHLQP